MTDKEETDTVIARSARAVAESGEIGNEWRDKAPKEWSPEDYADFVDDTDIVSVFFDFYNVTYMAENEEGEYKKYSKGFHPCSVAVSRAFAVQNKWKLHKCKLKEHNYARHAELLDDVNVPKATWICPSTGVDSGAPWRWLGQDTYIPITFATTDSIIDFASKVRTWYWELSLYKNSERYKEIFPKESFATVEEYEAQWDKVISHPFILEVDATRKHDVDYIKKGRRRDILEKEVYLDSMNEFINKVNSYIYSILGLDWGNWEWIFSGNGLYFLINGYLNSETAKENIEKRKGIKIDNSRYYNKNLFSWDRIVSKIKKLTEDIKFIEIDAKKQYMREYIKTPFSLHARYDRLSTPLTCLFGGNDKIDLKDELFLKHIEPRNIDKEFIGKYFKKEISGHEVNNFVNF